MRDPSRIKPFCDRLTRIWSVFPDLRFGQLMMILYDRWMSTYGRDWFYAEDDELIRFIEQEMVKY